MREDCFRNVHAFGDSSHLGCNTLLCFEWFLMSWNVAHYTHILPHLHHWLYLMDSLTLEMKALWDFKMSGSTHPVTQHCVSEDLNTHVCNNQM